MTVYWWVVYEQVLELAALRDDKLFYVYDDLTCLDQEPHGYRTASWLPDRLRGSRPSH